MYIFCMCCLRGYVVIFLVLEVDFDGVCLWLMYVCRRVVFFFVLLIVMRNGC